MLKLIPLVGALAALAPAPAPPPFWGATGHRAIARFAETHLSTQARTMLNQILPGQDLVSIAVWADSIRPTRPETGPWHFVNIPIMDTSYDAAKLCPNDDCVIGALTRQLAILSDPTKGNAARGDALRWVVHLVGDMHQPLHVGDRGDRGGNDLKLSLLDRPTNLHSVWDRDVVTAVPTDVEPLVAEMESRWTAHRSEATTIAQGTIVQWAMQSHDIARDVAYKNLPGNLQLTASYITTATGPAHDQLYRAAVRLTAVLERALTR